MQPADWTDPAILQERASQWQALLAKQQDLAVGLGLSASKQHELAQLCEAHGDERLATSAREIESDLRLVLARVLGLEDVILDKIAQAVSEASTALQKPAEEEGNR